MARRILLDTHAWLWFNGGDERLRPEVRDLLRDPDNDLYLSAASTWEIAIKVAAGRLELPMAPERYVPSRMTENGVLPLSIHPPHTLRAAALPMHHRDPFDRMLVAQAQVEALELLTGDPRLKPYDAPLIWAR